MANNQTNGNGALLDIEDLFKRFGGIQAVAGASFEVSPKTITALIGPNGAGKTTLFNVVTGFYGGDRGSVTFDGDEVLGEPPYSIARKGMVRTFQITKALAAMPVIDNMMLAAPNQPGELFRNVVFRPGAVRAREREVREQAMELLEIFNLTKLADDYAGTLSGGQRKLLELARVLMADPGTILLDEPAAGVNPTLLELIIDRVLDLNAQGKSILLIEHNMEMVARLCSRVVVMAGGRFLTEGTPDDIARNPAVVDAYLGGVA